MNLHRDLVENALSRSEKLRPFQPRVRPTPPEAPYLIEWRLTPGGDPPLVEVTRDEIAAQTDGSDLDHAVVEAVWSKIHPILMRTSISRVTI
jgi:hypothetical protein